MRTALLILLALVITAVVLYLLWFPRNTFVSVYRPDGGAVTFSQTGVSFEKPPDHYLTNGFSHIDDYIAKLVVPTNRLKSLSFFTPDGMRGFGLDAKDGIVQASFTVEWRDEPEKEAAIRSFFRSLGARPTRDYLAGNGGVADATRIVDYRVTTNATELTTLSKRILQALCSISPEEALDIDYDEQ